MQACGGRAGGSKAQAAIANDGRKRPADSRRFWAVPSHLLLAKCNRYATIAKLATRLLAACPIVGDKLYGGAAGLYLSQLKQDYKRGRDPERPLMGRLALHAQRLSLRHPVTGEALAVEAPLPHDFEISLKYLRRFAR